MPPDAFAVPASTGRMFDRIPEAWRAALPAALAAWVALAIAFASDWSRIASIAWNSSTFNHILLIPAILAALVYQRRGEIAQIAPQIWWPALIPCAGAALLWLLGAFSGLDLARQLGAVALLVATVPLFFGVRVTAALAFPLFYFFLLVPLGEELVPALQLVTAKLTIAMVEASGIPARIEGVYIDTPVGLFEVAEACSGVKFLIAMVALGLLTANLCFKSWKRRIAFVAACIVVPILANGVRAFATIWVAQSVGAERAVSFDHIVYGWFFFALVVAIVLAAAWPFFDRSPGAPLVDAERIATSPLLARLEGHRVAWLTALAALILIAGGAHAWARAGEALRAELPSKVGLPEIDGWSRVPYPKGALAWRPQAEGADVRLQGRYRNEAGQEVDVLLALYSSQGDGREPGGYGQGALPPHSGWSWHSPGPHVADGRSEWLRGDEGTLRLAETWYVNGSLVTGSNMRLKLHSMGDKLLLNEHPAALLIVSAADQSAEQAGPSVEAFMRAAGPPRQWMDRLGITE